jgi:preprotein translocase subunit YajC
MARDDNSTAGRLLLAHFGAAPTRSLFVSILPILVLLFILMWFLVIRPQRRRQQEQQRIMDNLSPGQEVLTAGGLFGTVHSVVGDDEVRVEIAPDVYVRVARRAIASVMTDEDSELDELERAQQEAKEEVLAARDAGER